MFKLLKKEMGLTANIVSYLFLFFAVMTLVPNYPILMGAYFICFGVFQTFQTGREANDITFTAMLPVKKKDIVAAKYAFAVIVELLGYFVCLVLTLVKMFVLKDDMPYSENAMMNANLAYLGYVLLIYTCFNVFFIGVHFKTAHKIGVPFLFFALAALVVLAVGETLHVFFPVLNEVFHYSHVIVLAVCAVIYAAATAGSLLLSQKRFLQIDL